MMLESTGAQRANNNETDVNRSLQPMGVMGILGAMFRMYRKHFWRFLGSFTVEALLFSLLFLLASTSANILMMIVLSAVGGAVAVLFIAEAFIASAQLYLGQPAPFRVTFRQALRRFWPYLGSGMLFSLVIGVLTVTILGIPFAIYLGVRWSFYHIPILVENQPVLNAWSRCSEQVKGTWWRVFGTLLAGQLLPLIVGSILSLIGPILLKSLESIQGAEVIIMILGIVSGFFGLGVLLLALLAPTFAITILYYDLRVRKGRSVLPLSTTT